MRTVVDVAFAAGHWIIHRPVLWHSAAVSHKTHHEHNHPSVLTNRTSIFALSMCLLCSAVAVLLTRKS